MTQKSAVILLKAIAATAALLILWVDAAGAAPLRIAYAAIASNTAGIWMAEGSGAFKNQGLDVQFVYPSSSATSVVSLTLLYIWRFWS